MQSRTPEKGSDHDSNCTCIRCKVLSLQVSPKVKPSSKSGPPRTPNNNWEKGIVKDSRGMPLLQPGTIEPMPIKTYVENRHKIEDQKKQMHQS